uniref:C2H2-type domain-containing protein n=1 Tax=Scophthalmus maximus TaxID=52904 RepID=A0A8D3CGW2_SCOMX
MINFPQVEGNKSFKCPSRIFILISPQTLEKVERINSGVSVNQFAECSVRILLSFPSSPQKCPPSSRGPSCTSDCRLSPIPATGESCCRVCGKFFRHKSAFLKHVLRREGCTDLCGVCGKLLGSDGGLRRHLRTHSEEKKSCGDGADEEQEDAESEMGGGDEDWKESDGYGVDGVKDETKDGPKTKIHASNTPDGPKNKDCKDSSHVKYCCKVCGRSFCYRASFLKHVQEDETDADLCGVCGERFETAASLKLHLRTYIRTNDCDVCGKPFDGQKQLEMHVRTHTGEKPFVCSVCGKAFYKSGALKIHMRSHTGEKPYLCNVCGKSFTASSSLTKHMGVHEGQNPALVFLETMNPQPPVDREKPDGRTDV